jgi:peptidoglycan/xylan/chitin deacetylase (PgdA/CDA1 family)
MGSWWHEEGRLACQTGQVVASTTPVTYHPRVAVKRRDMLVGLGGAVVGAGAGVGEEAARAAIARSDTSHLPFYGGYASAIRPDLTRPSAPSLDVHWRADRTDRALALTFDDGPRPDWTPLVLAALDAEDVPGTFFCQGVNVVRHGSIHRDSPGRHELANHTWDHPDLARLDLGAATDQLHRTSEAMHTAFGVAPTLFRPPYGHISGAALLAAAQSGLTTVFWSAQMREDQFVSRPAGIVDYAASVVHPGAVVLFHDVGSSVRRVAIDNLRGIIGRLRDEGYTFHTVSDLLRVSHVTA